MTDLKALSDAATQGEWETSHRSCGHDDGYRTQIFPTSDPDNSICTLHWHSVKTDEGFRTDRAENAQLICALVNAYRAGTLVDATQARNDVLQEAAKACQTEIALSDCPILDEWSVGVEDAMNTILALKPTPE